MHAYRPVPIPVTNFERNLLIKLFVPHARNGCGHLPTMDIYDRLSLAYEGQYSGDHTVVPKSQTGCCRAHGDASWQFLQCQWNLVDPKHLK
eukprot:6006891-Amphidinium_carterae.2